MSKKKITRKMIPDEGVALKPIPKDESPVIVPGGIVTNKPKLVDMHKAEKLKKDLKKTLATAPQIRLRPSSRWYGETFYPQYNAFLEKLKQLAE